MVITRGIREDQTASRVSMVSNAGATQRVETIAKATEVLPMLSEHNQLRFPCALRNDRRYDSSWPYVAIMILGIALVSGALGPF